MTIVVSQKSRIHFQFEGERGAFLILHHGLFGSLEDWYEAGYVADLAQDFRLILPDARGHGRSERHVQGEEYRLSRFTEDVLAIMDWLDVRNAHFVGYSLGALVGFDLLYRHPERVRLVMLGGEAPIVTEAARAQWAELAARLRASSFARWVEEARSAERLVRSQPVVDEAAHDPAVALLEAMAAWEGPQEERLAVRSPITLFSGAEDPAAERTEQAARRIQRARFLSFPGLTHRRMFEDKMALLEALNRFIRASRRPGEGAPAREARGPERPPYERGPGEESAFEPEARPTEAEPIEQEPSGGAVPEVAQGDSGERGALPSDAAQGAAGEEEDLPPDAPPASGFVTSQDRDEPERDDPWESEETAFVEPAEPASPGFSPAPEVGEEDEEDLAETADVENGGDPAERTAWDEE